MTKFLVLYKADASAQEQMANSSTEETRAGMEVWMQWFERVGDAVVDGGSPVQSESTVVGFSILQAESRSALDTALEGHPHAAVGTLEVCEFLPMPGM